MPTRTPPRTAPDAARATALEELSFYIGRAYFNYKLMLERILADLDLDSHLSPGMGHILFALFEEDDIIIKDIAARTKLSLPTITVMLQQMERAGILKRRRDPDDGRAVRVRLTPMARSLEPRCHTVVDRLNAVLHKGMTAEEVRLTKSAFARMIDSMREDEQESRESRDQE